jgi:hypothetical protein
VNDVTIAPAGGSSALDTQPDARANPTGASAGEVKPEGAAATDAAKPAETVADPKDAKKKSNKKNNKKTDPKAKQGNQPPQQ